MDWKSKRPRAVLEAALLEDKAASDLTTALTVEAHARASGTIVAQQACVVAGLGAIPVILELFRGMHAGPLGRFEVVSHPEIFDGVTVRKGQPLAVIRYNAAAILSTERVLLNVLGRMCGIATLTAAYVKAIAGTGAEIVDTRKTVPGLRALDRYAVCCGGGLNHRQDLEDGILIKGNHIAVGGGLPATLARALEQRKSGHRVHVEVRSLEELHQAVSGGAESILLDNMTPAAVRRAVTEIRATHSQLLIEASGGITLENVRSYAEAGVNYVTIGSVTHSAPAADLSLRVTLETPSS